MAHWQTYRVEPATNVRNNPPTTNFNASRHPPKNWAIPTLGDTYELLMTYSTRIVYFLHNQMMNGHRLPDPWDEACALEKAMTRTTLMFYCLWQSEGDQKRFDDIQEWATIVHEDAKTKITAIELFVRLEKRRRQRRSSETDVPSQETRNPTQANPRTQTEHTPTPGEINIPEYQARPDFYEADEAKKTYELKAIRDTDTRSDTHMQTYAIQMAGQDGQLPHNPKPNSARRAREFTGKRTPSPAKHSSHQPLRHRTNPSTPPISHKMDPGNHRTNTQAELPRNYALPQDSAQYTHPKTYSTSPGIRTKYRHPCEDQMKITPNNNAERRRPESRGTLSGENDRRERNRFEERRFSDTRNDHRKRRTATTKETTAW